MGWERARLGICSRLMLCDDPSGYGPRSSPLPYPTHLYPHTPTHTPLPTHPYPHTPPHTPSLQLREAECATLAREREEALASEREIKNLREALLEEQRERSALSAKAMSLDKALREERRMNEALIQQLQLASRRGAGGGGGGGFMPPGGGVHSPEFPSPKHGWNAPAPLATSAHANGHGWRLSVSTPSPSSTGHSSPKLGRDGGNGGVPNGGFPNGGIPNGSLPNGGIHHGIANGDESLSHLHLTPSTMDDSRWGE